MILSVAVNMAATFYFLSDEEGRVINWGDLVYNDVPCLRRTGASWIPAYAGTRGEKQVGRGGFEPPTHGFSVRNRSFVSICEQRTNNC